MRFIFSPLLFLIAVLSAPFSPALAETDAPFGLTWGASVEDLKGAGVRLQQRVSDQSGVRFAARDLPKALSDLGEAILSFGKNNMLHKVEAIGEDITNDPDGARLKLRYAALARALAGKYGQGVSRHVIEEPWTRPNDFLNGIYRGTSYYYTNFTGDNVTVRLEIRATRRGLSNYAIIFQHKAPPSGNGTARDKDVL